LLNSLDQQGFKTSVLDLSRTNVVPENASLVVVLEPRREFADSEVRALHQYLQKGGRLFLDYNWSPTQGWNPDGGELGKLLGFSVGPRRVMHMIRAGYDGRGIAGDPRVAKLDLVVNQNHAVTRRIFLGRQLLQLADARPLMRRSDVPEGVRYEDLLVTGPEAWLEVPPGPDGQYSYDPPRVPNPFGTYSVGAVIEVDGETGAPGIAVVVTGLFANNTGMPINGMLASNIANWLTERRVLLDIKGQKYEARQLQLVTQQLYAVWYLLVAGVPLSLLAIGLFVFWRRRRHVVRRVATGAGA
jgi:ABC-2 type transport system permease protein